MAGQPASVGAPPRVLLYVGGPRRLAPPGRPPPDCPNPQPLKAEGKPSDRSHRDSNSEFGAETFRIALEAGEIATYQTQCPAPVDSIMPSMQSIALQQAQSVGNFSEENCDSEVVGKSYVNYQFLEQNQSVVNILNQQVGVVCESSEENRGAQLVRTAEGVLLAVLPESPAVPTPALRTIIVPLGWKRVLSGSAIVYFSPSGTPLSSLPQLKEYLQTEGTCKCGLTCPLRPDIAFSFDPKVSSKPYQPASGAELTKLCNHKRKLLATLQARAHETNLPPLVDQNKVAEVGLVKKKMKKRAGYPANMNPQLMVQRDRPMTDMKLQETELKRTMSPGMGFRPNQCMPTFAPVQHVSNPLQEEVKQENHVQKSSHYLTVSSGWITQHDNPEGHKPSHPNTPVFDNNGQIIGVNTGYKQPNVKNTSVYAHHATEQSKDQKIAVSQHNVQTAKKEEESQIFCGLNQPLTPEVMQKINEQQQIFIQQNQKQIERAMQGFRTQMAENCGQNKPGQFVPQGQLVIQNGAVVKANPAKTPPWQVKRNDNGSSCMTSQSPKPLKMDSLDFDDSNTNMSDDSSSPFGPFVVNEHMNQSMCSRVPPLPQQYNMMGQQWPAADLNKKKPRANNKGGRKKASPDNKTMIFGNNGIRPIDSKGDPQGDNVPSFMDDPSGYLAQQTVLLNNTISRQVGMNPSLDANHYDNTTSYVQHQPDKSSKPMSKPCDVPNMYRHNMVPNSSPSPNTPDSSVLSDKSMDNPAMQCCKGCNVSMKSNQEFLDNQMRLKYMKPNVYKLELDGSNPAIGPRHFEDNPVTSSTFVERSPMHDSCGPIQAGQVSTSNVSPPGALLPEPSPTLSNSSRNTDTPHSGGSNSSQYPPNYQFPVPSSAYSNSCKDFNCNPPTPGSNQTFPYNTPGPPNNITGTQMMHFISNHNVNKNLMEVDNIAMAVKSVQNTPEMYRSDSRKRMENSMPGYCPPPHLGGGPAHSLAHACYAQPLVTTMASGFSVTRDTVTSVLAGKANTVTTSINASQANYVRLPPPPSVNLATSYAIPNNQPDPFINSLNIPTSYPLHIAGTTAQNMITRSPLEIIQNVINNVPLKTETGNAQRKVNLSGRRSALTTPGQILISSTGQIIVSNNQMPPPPPKTLNTSVMQSCNMSNVTTVPSGVQPMANQPAVVVNTLPSPFVIQSPMMAVDGQVLQQNQVIPQIMSGVVSGQPSNGPRQADGKAGFLQGVAMLSPESIKKRGKKKKVQANITNVLQISAPQQNPGNLMVQHSPQHNTSPQFSPRGFQLSPNNNISPTGMVQALTIVPGKSGTPAHIVMNGQGGTSNFSPQQILTNTSPSQQINLLQPVNLINNGSGVMSNFPAFQQFIVPNIGGMMMTADGTAIIQDNSNGMPVQLQLQTVNGQNVLTPVQNSAVFTNGNGSVVIRAQNQQGKILQSQHSPGAQFLSQNGQVVMNSPNFNGQLSPLLANLSPTNVTFNASSQQVRSANLQAQDFIQTNQMGQTLMVPISPKPVSMPSATNSRNNSTFVQQNTTIVQQQTTMVTNSLTPPTISNNQGATSNRLSIDPTMLLSKKGPPRRFLELPENRSEEKEDNSKPFSETEVDNAMQFMNEFGLGSMRHSVSTATQTLVNQRGGKSPGVSGSSPPDTTTHSPLGALEPCSPRVGSARCLSTQANYADTTTKSPEPTDASSQAMVQCVSSSEQDLPETDPWPTPEYPTDTDMMPKVMLPPHRSANPSETIDNYPQNMGSHSHPMSQNHMLPVSSNYFDRTHAYKRKPDFCDTAYRPDKLMRNNRMVMKESEYDPLGLRAQRNYQPSGPSSDTMQKVFDRRTLGPGDERTSNEECSDTCRIEAKGHSEPKIKEDKVPEKQKKLEEKGPREFEVGDLVWGPVKGYASWPGKLDRREEGGRWRVRWFGGDKPPCAVDDCRLLTLSEGLEAHHAARTKHRKSRKLNTLLENAIQEAMSDLDKTTDAPTHSESVAGASETAITDTPKRKKEKVKKEKKSPIKIALKTGDKLRSSR